MTRCGTASKLPGMSDIDLAVTRSKRLERLLEQKLGATGKGLHQKASSVEGRLPPQLLRDLRLVATVRNKLVHEDDYKRIEDRSRFLRACDDAERGLKALGGGRAGGRLVRVAVVMVLLVVLLLIAWRIFGR